MIRVVPGLVALFSFTAAAQAPAFDVASIRESKPGRESIEVEPGSLIMRNVTPGGCIRWAYDVQYVQVSGPEWLNDTWFDIAAKSSDPAQAAEIKRMLQTLLAERFKLVLHRQTKETSALVLVVGKNGHKLQPTDTEGSPSFQTGKMMLTGNGATLAELTNFLARELRIPVIDQTGLTGRFNYHLDINSYVTEEVLKTATHDRAPVDAPSIVAQAMQAQLGLKVESKKVPIEILVIDHLEKTPTEN